MAELNRLTGSFNNSKTKLDGASSFFRAALIGAAAAAAIETASAAAHNTLASDERLQGLLSDDGQLFGDGATNIIPLVDTVDGSAPLGDANPLGNVASITDVAPEVAGLDALGLAEILNPTGPIVGSVAGVENNVVDDLHLLLENVGHNLGSPLNQTIHTVTRTGDNLGLGHINEPGRNGDPSDLLTEIINAPNDILTGRPVEAVVGDIVHEIKDTVQTLGADVNFLVDAVNLQQPLGLDLVQNIAGDLGNGNLLDVGSPGGLLSAIVDTKLDQGSALIDFDLAGDTGPSTSNYLIDLDVGPTASSSPLIANILGGPDAAPDHQLEINAIEVGANGPRLIDADLLTSGEALDIANVLGGGEALDIAHLIPVGDGSLLPIAGAPEHLFG